MNNEIFQRLILSIGIEKFNKLQNKRIAIIGLGGVGSYSLEVIARSGINNILIMDRDVIDVTNINRQLLALNSNIGEYKTDLAYKRILDINPNCNITKYTTFLDESNMNLILDFKPDYVIDCIDTISSKYELIKTCLLNDIKIVSSMGTANKFYPEKLMITTIDKTEMDPIARIIRQKLKKDRLNKKFYVVYSNEEPFKQKEVLNDSTIRKESMPLSSNAFVPSTAGILLSSKVINLLLEELSHEN
jgi:tRNA A37 threonylcarbamoyladenosine dehydratase